MTLPILHIERCDEHFFKIYHAFGKSIGPFRKIIAKLLSLFPVAGKVR